MARNDRRILFQTYDFPQKFVSDTTYLLIATSTSGIRIEPTTLALIRGFVAAALLAGLVIYGFETAIRQPAAETSAGLPMRYSRQSVTSYHYSESGILANMAFFVVRSKWQMQRNKLTPIYELVSVQCERQSVLEQPHRFDVWALQSYNFYQNHIDQCN